MDKMLKYNLQFFADDETNTDVEAVDTDVETNAGDGKDTSIDDYFANTSADEILKRPELAKAIQRIADARVTSALNTARAKWQDELEAEKDEAKKLARMSDEQREKYNFKKEKEAFENERAQFAHEQLILATGKELQKRGLSADFSAYLTGTDAEDTNNRIDAFEKLFNESLSDAINTRMKGKTPKEVSTNKSLTVDDIKSMSPSEINARWDEVKDIIKK